MKNIILASASPRRKHLLEQAEIPFTVRTADTPENFPEGMSVREAPAFISRNKAQAVWNALSNAQKAESLIIAADTVVVLGAQLIGKPQSPDQAMEMLKMLSGKRHEVVTAVVFRTMEQQRSITEITEVYFRQLKESQLGHYVEHYKPFDKAGAYAIQEWIGLIGIERINGDFYNVMGLPVGRVVETLKEFSLLT